MGQMRMLREAVPLQEALQDEGLKPDERDRLLLVERIKRYGENRLGLDRTRNYETVHLAGRGDPLFLIAAAPKDRLEPKTWWFPVVGRMSYLGFFDRDAAERTRERLLRRQLDVTLGTAQAYSTLGWFQDPVPRNLLMGSTPELVETLLHEMTHATLYVKGQSAFNEALAVLVSKHGAAEFMAAEFGPDHRDTLLARDSLADERLFSGFLATLIDRLAEFYDSELSYDEKVQRREVLFARGQEDFARLQPEMRTARFAGFAKAEINNAYLVALGTYHGDYPLLESLLFRHHNRINELLAFLRELSSEQGNMLERIAALLERRNTDNPVRNSSLRSLPCVS